MYKKEYYLKNKEKMNAKAKTYYKLHKEQIKNNVKKWYQKNKENELSKSKERLKQWRINNPERYKEIRSRNDKKFIQRRKELLWSKLGKFCNKCGNNDERVLEFNHIIPQTKIRSKRNHLVTYMREIHNLEVLCANCHRIVTYEQQRRGLLNTSPRMFRKVDNMKIEYDCGCIMCLCNKHSESPRIENKAQIMTVVENKGSGLSLNAPLITINEPAKPNNPEKCIETISKDGWITEQQCGRAKGYGKDNLYCKQHAKARKENF